MLAQNSEKISTEHCNVLQDVKPHLALLCSLYSLFLIILHGCQTLNGVKHAKYHGHRDNSHFFMPCFSRW